MKPQTATLLGALVLWTALVFGTGLFFAPVPWPDASAFYLPGLDLVSWPSLWRMHAQAAFVPSYDEANFNLMPALPALLGMLAKLGLPPTLLARAFSWSGLVAWVIGFFFFLKRRASSPRGAWLALILALAAFLDPVLRWGTLVVRTETWVALCGLGMLALLGDGEKRGAGLRVQFAALLALSALFHFEAVYWVPAACAGLWLLHGEPKLRVRRIFFVGGLTALFLSPWMIYALTRLPLFWEQMQIQFARLAMGHRGPHDAYGLFHGLFPELGSPAGLPKFYNLAKFLVWGLLLTSAGFLGSRLRKGLTALEGFALAAVASFFFLWLKQPEAWFVTLVHFAIWPLVGLALLRSESRLRYGLTAAVAAYAILAGAATLAQMRSFSPYATRRTYSEWIECIDQAIVPGTTSLKLWQPYAPDILLELSRKHPDWSLTRALDFPNRFEEAKASGLAQDVVVMTRFFNPQERVIYSGKMRMEDVLRLSQDEDLPFGSWSLGALTHWKSTVCEVGPFWAVIFQK